MKRYRAHKNNKSNMHQVRSPFYYREQREKLKNNAGSTFLRIKLFNSANEIVHTGDDALDTFYNITQPLSHIYMLEFDNHQNAEPHFHIWKTNGFSKRSDTRSPAISLRTNGERGVVYLYKERKKEVLLNNIQSKEIIDLVEECRFTLFLMFHAFKHKKVKSFEGIDEEFLLSLFSKIELDALKQKFENKYQEHAPEQFSK